jgi:hypothetical protein
MQKDLRKPKNWQDFEKLCKILWGEIWACPNTIKINGRRGQNQMGVDIYAIPQGEEGYFGIQCKCKDENLNSKMNVSEIDQIIVEAKEFKPELKSLLIATTSPKDSIIEEYVRKINLDLIQNKLFSIELFCWEDIVDLINENPNTFRWYITENNFKEKYDVDILFDNETKDGIIYPRFIRKITRYNLILERGFGNLINNNFLKPIDTFGIGNIGTLNKSWEIINIIVTNIGTMVIEDFKLFLIFENNIRGLENTFNQYMKNMSPVSISKNFASIKPKANDSFIIQKDLKKYRLNILSPFIKSPISIKWNLIARNFDKSGDIILNSEPQYTDEVSFLNVYDESELKEDEITYKDIMGYSIE